MSQQRQHTDNFAHIQAQNLSFLTGDQPPFIRLKIKVHLDLRLWEASAGANRYTGALPEYAAKSGEQTARLAAMNRAVRKLRWDYATAQIVSIDFEESNSNAPLLARLHNGGERWVA